MDLKSIFKDTASALVVTVVAGIAVKIIYDKYFSAKNSAPAIYDETIAALGALEPYVL